MVLLLASVLATAQENGGDVILHIQQGNLGGLKSVIRTSGVDSLYGESGKTMLQLAIELKELRTVKFLVKNGADIEQLSQGKTPLIHAVNAGSVKIASYLLAKGADVDGKSEKNNTPLIYASYLGNVEMAGFLIGKGADINFVNDARKTPLDYARLFQQDDMIAYLRHLHAESESKYYPDFFDGPHVVYNNNGHITVFYMIRDSALNTEKVVSREIPFSGDSVIFQGFEGDTQTYRLYLNKKNPPSGFSDVDSIFAVGDIHGSYDELVTLLQVHGIIDEQLSWSWGNGHLVFMGDIFDRGDDVTVTLWLIHRLEQEASRKGGFVHYILGNHELMALNGDTRDVSGKYFYFMDFLGVTYAVFFDMETELGSWLRTRNLMVRINDLLFVHGGISPAVMELGLDIESINHLMSRALTDTVPNEDVPLLEFVFGETGPLWYRGYFGVGRTYLKATAEEIDRITDYFGVNSIIVGHTNVPKIVSLYEGKVIATDIPFYDDGYQLQGLLVKNGKLYRALIRGQREILE